MSKRLILILALAFVVGITAAAFAEVQNVKVSGDITAIGARRQLTIGDNSTTERNASSFMASIVRVRVDADLTDNVMATVRLLNERYWGGGVNSTADTYGDDNQVEIDLAYATMKEFLYSPLSLTVGRQELHFGNDMIVGAINTNNSNGGRTSSGLTGDPDLSMRKSFDAIRATLNYDPLMIDVIAAQVKENTLTKRDDNKLYGVYATYAVDKKTSVSPYWFMRQRQAEDSSVVAQTIGKDDTVHALGVLVKSSPKDNLSVSAEGAVQLGKAARTPDYVSGYTGTAFTNKDVSRQAWAVELGAMYAMPKMKMSPTLTALYAFFSGQKGDVNKKVSSWDPMYENQTYGHIANAMFNQSNAHIAGAILTAKPKDDVTLKGEYYAFWWDKVYGDQTILDVRADPVCMTDKKFAGQEIDLTATYDYTEDVQFSLMGGMLVPGNAFDKSNRKMANEVIGSMKVTF